MSRLRILFFVGGFSSGGTERHLSQILPALKDNGWDLSVLMFGDDGPMSNNIRDAGIEIIPAPKSSWCRIPKVGGVVTLFSQFLFSLKTVSKIKPDVIHSFLGMPTILGGGAGWVFPCVKVISSKRNQMSRPDSFFKEGMLERWALRRADCVMAHSSEVFKELESVGVKAHKLKLVHNGINVTEYSNDELRRADLRSKFGWSNQEVVFIQTANLIPYKGHEFLLKALGKLSRRDNKLRPWRVVLVGQGTSSYTKKLQQIVNRLDLDGAVEFLGMRSDISSLLEASDVGLLLSAHEGFSNAILEYMASCKPTIATNVGGNKDAVEDEGTGFLISYENEEALAIKLGIFLQDTDKLLNMGYNARRKVEDDFSMTKCIEGYESIYSSFIKHTLSKVTG